MSDTPSATRARDEPSRVAFGAPHTGERWPRGARCVCQPNQVQGDEFKHITVVLDKQFCPAAGYTALSRVERASAYMLAGKMTREHFVPATWMDPA